MKTIYMGMNISPAWLETDEIIAKWERENNEEMAEMWRKSKEESLRLKSEITDEVESNDVVALSWECTGITRHAMHAGQWKAAMPEYDFEIDGYKCIVRKKDTEKR